jgi:hypothetical protein
LFHYFLQRRILEGAKGTILSIRKFYPAGDAQNVAFEESPSWGLEQFCQLTAAELHTSFTSTQMRFSFRAWTAVVVSRIWWKSYKRPRRDERLLTALYIQAEAGAVCFDI